MYLIRRWRGALVAALLILSLVMTERRAESYGDTLQVMLPLAGWGCSIATGSGLEYAVRYAVMWLSVHAAKHGLPDDLALRPSGGGLGFPSGHSSSSAFGASALVFGCIENAPLLRTAIVFGGSFTAASRIEAGAHNIWQVLAGAAWAVFCERFLRRPGPLRRRVAAAVFRWRGGARGRTR